MTVFILETGYSPNQEVAVFWNNGIHGVTFSDTSALGLRYVLAGCGVKAVFLRAKNKDERQAILENMQKLWNERKGYGKVKAKRPGMFEGKIPSGYERVAIKVKSGESK